MNDSLAIMLEVVHVKEERACNDLLSVQYGAVQSDFVMIARSHCVGSDIKTERPFASVWKK